jgi:D-glycero-alpha-D-manno-heptose-7-phosphate kinase
MFILQRSSAFLEGTARQPVRIRSRAPLRLGLAGGGTDVSPYSDQFGGAVLNATIDRYAFAFLKQSIEPEIRFIASDLGVEECFSLDFAAMGQAKLQLHATVYRRMITQYCNGELLPISLRTQVDAPAGSGLGSSSALVVAMVEAFRAALGLPLGPNEIARLAYEIERIDLALSGGKQDQYAAAFGGVNFIEFMADDRVIVNPLRVSQAVLNELETSLVICFSGVSRSSEKIIEQQRLGMVHKTKETMDSLHQLKADALDMKLSLLSGQITDMAGIMNRSWIAKKRTAAGITTKEIDALYETAMKAGALAGKVSGAGGGGFIMFLVPPERRLSVIRALNKAGGQAEGARFTMDGVESWIAPN